MRTRTLSLLALFILAAILLTSCARNDRNEMPVAPVVSGEDFLALEEPSTFGNCLSVPVIFAEGYGLAGVEASVNPGLRGMPDAELFIQPYDDVTYIDGFQVYRNPSVNEWQADWATGAQYGGEVPVEIDWADNIVRTTWTERSKVRVEVILTATIDPVALPLEGYSMFSLGGTMLDEVFVTNTVKYTATQALVYSPTARMTIQKLDAQGGTPTHDLYSGACYEGFFYDGRTGAYSAEVNMGGKCIYGYNWDVATMDLEDRVGWYRLTFSLDPMADYVDLGGNTYSYARNVAIASLNPGDMAGATEPDVALYPASLGADGYSSSIDVYIRERPQGGGGGGKGNPDGGGKGGGGSKGGRS